MKFKKYEWIIVTGCCIGLLGGCAQETIKAKESSLRTLTATNPQLSLGIDSMNDLIDACNAKPETCQTAEAIVRLDALDSAIGNVIQYLKEQEVQSTQTTVTNTAK